MTRLGTPLVGLLGAIGLVTGLSAQAQTFGNALAEARWELDASVFECRLSYPLPGFGSAHFAQRAGETQAFFLRQENRYLAAGEAQVVAASPIWRETLVRETLAPAQVSESARPLRLNWRRSQSLAAKLQEGMQLAFENAAWYGRGDSVRLVLEPVGFRPAFDAYQACLADLLPVNFDQVERTAIYFPSGNQELPDEELEKLDLVARYTQADKQVVKVYVDGHTDGAGLRAENLNLSRERAESVAQFLKDRGVSEDKVVTRWHGERYPVASNQTPEGRAENRRVTIRLERVQKHQASRR